MITMDTELDLIRADYAECAECGGTTTIEVVPYLGAWLAVIECESCGAIFELELEQNGRA